MRPDGLYCVKTIPFKKFTHLLTLLVLRKVGPAGLNLIGLRLSLAQLTLHRQNGGLVNWTKMVNRADFLFELDQNLRTVVPACAVLRTRLKLKINHTRTRANAGSPSIFEIYEFRPLDL